MHTFLPYPTFEKSVEYIDTMRLQHQINQILVILRSLSKVYPPKKHTGNSGYEIFPVARMWKTHELQLAKFGLVTSLEWLNNRPLSGKNQAASFKSRQNTVIKWREMVEWLEDNSFPDTVPDLIGDEDFHSAFRAYLLYKDIQTETFRRFKKGLYPRHAVTKDLLPRKSSWRRFHFEAIWEFFGQPDAPYYGKFNWTEAPDDSKLFYEKDKSPYLADRFRRQAANPVEPWFNPNRKLRA